MIDFVLAVAPANVAEVKNFLVARGIVNNTAPPLTGAINGFEYTASSIPNPFVVSGAGTPQNPYVYDTKNVYLVRFSGPTETDQTKDDVDPSNTTPFTKSKLVQWVKANGTPVVLTSANGWSANCWRVTVNGVNVWLSNDIGRIGVWQ